MFSQKIKNWFLDCVFPKYCLGCGCFLESATKTYLCQSCQNKIIINSEFFCPICLKRLADSTFKKCQHSNKKSSLDFLGFATSYENPVIKDLIHKYKYAFAKEIRWTLAQTLIFYLNKAFEDDFSRYALVAIPLHRRRFNWRGFNQSEEVAKILSVHFRMPILNNCLFRAKQTDSQAGLKDFQKRKLNLENAFALKNQELLKNKNIVLLDDVYTSGATLEEAAKAVKSAGAKRIIGLVIAK